MKETCQATHLLLRTRLFCMVHPCTPRKSKRRRGSFLLVVTLVCIRRGEWLTEHLSSVFLDLLSSRNSASKQVLGYPGNSHKSYSSIDNARAAWAHAKAKGTWKGEGPMATPQPQSAPRPGASAQEKTV